jgi:O-antigen/teichoic acid export membrane protein
MVYSKTVSYRMAISVLGNAMRLVLGLVSGFVVARGLGPSGYGNLMFLVTTLTALQVGLQLGSANAFYTFLSQYARNLDFYFIYYVWLAVQLVLVLLAVGVFFPDSLVEQLWNGHERTLVLLAALAVFCQKIVWPMVTQIGESRKQTLQVQIFSFFIALLYLAVVSALYVNNSMSVLAVLYLLIVQYTAATLFSYWVFGKDDDREKEALPVSQLFSMYWRYCRPLVVLSLAVVVSQFFDRWLLQRYGGALEQGYYQISLQLSIVSLLATTSILKIFWKEIAERWVRNDKDRVKVLYLRVNRGLVMFGAFVSGLLLPWSEEIVFVLLGEEYVNGWMVFAVMLLYPIYQSMGQVGSTMLLATGNSLAQVIVSVVFIVLSLPISFLVLAPNDGGVYSGLNLGAFGLALKMVLLAMISVNVQAWVVCRVCGWKFDWAFQAVGIPILIFSGFFAASFTTALDMDWGVSAINLVVSLCISLLVNLVALAFIIYNLPWLVGFRKEEIDRLIASFYFKKIDD